MTRNHNIRITRRVTNQKRHTVGYVLTGGQQVTRSRAVQMASSGQISGVRVVNGSSGRYLQSTNSRGLYELPITQQPRRAVRRNSSKQSI